ncbi:hypothetical protein MCOR17_011415 [Pyricularia oryzae]|nr:hypothetical protein MCOR17_011415 [Pyricularia oryzae]
MDMGLIATMNGRERTLNEWKAMIKEADPRFLLTKVSQSPGSMLAVFEIVTLRTPCSAPPLFGTLKI